MDILQLLTSRRTIRKYTPKEIPEDLINILLEAGRWAPSAHNGQPWKFVVIKDKDIIRGLGVVLVTGKFIVSAPLAIAVVVDPAASHRFLEDGAIAIQNILLEAHSQGFGAAWIGCYNAPQEEPAKKLLEIPSELRLQAIVAIGYPAESPEKTRKPIEEIVYYNKYGTR